MDSISIEVIHEPLGKVSAARNRDRRSNGPACATRIVGSGADKRTGCVQTLGAQPVRQSHQTTVLRVSGTSRKLKVFLDQAKERRDLYEAQAQTARKRTAELVLAPSGLFQHAQRFLARSHYREQPIAQLKLTRRMIPMMWTYVREKLRRTRCPQPRRHPGAAVLRRSLSDIENRSNAPEAARQTRND